MEVEKKLSVEDLMKPRYKIIADWPTNLIWTVGTTLNLWELDEGRTIDIWIKYCEKYPHLFKKLEWWESDLKKVEYVKIIKYEAGYWNKGSIVPVVSFCAKEGLPYGYYITHNNYIPIYDLEPATESEYLTLNK